VVLGPECAESTRLVADHSFHIHWKSVMVGLGGMKSCVMFGQWLDATFRICVMSMRAIATEVHIHGPLTCIVFAIGSL
jgi:hypothetical protein